MSEQAGTITGAIPIDGELEHLSARQRAYTLLRQGILAGRIPVSTVLDTTKVAHELRMSRTPVREALQQLLQEGLVERGQRRQMVVRRIPAEQRREIFLMRDALERAVVRRAAEAVSEDDLDDLRALLYRQRRASEAGDDERFIELDERFHLRLAEAANLPTFRKVLAELRAFIRLIGIAAIAQPGRMDQVTAEHEAILDAVENGDPDLAATAMRDHLTATEEVLGRKPESGLGPALRADSTAMTRISR
jgi:DNA-binding GntR family transcriptional regulator